MNKKDINVLMVGSDTSILREGSDSFVRMRDYGRLVTRLDIALFNGHFLGGREDEVYRISDNVFVHPRSFWGLLGLFKVSGSRLSFVLNHKVDLVTVQDPFILGIIGKRLAGWLRAGFHVQIHTDFLSPHFRRESLYNRLKVLVARSVLRHASGIRVVSERIKTSMKSLGLGVEPVVLPIWTDIESIKNRPVLVDLKKKYPKFKTVFLVASRLTVEKNIFLAVDAMRKIVKEFPDAGLVIVGDGPLKKMIEGFVRGEGLQKNVIFEDWTDDLPSYYKTCDIFLNTSNYEGYGRTIVEALAAGTPVITTDVGASNEFIENSQNGFIVPVGSLRDLADVLISVLKSNSLLEKLKNGAKNTELGLGTKEEYLEAYTKSWASAVPDIRK